MEKIQRFLISMLNPEGSVSFGRTMSMLTLMACLSWDTANVFFAWSFNHHLPPGIAPLSLLPDATVLVGQSAFVSSCYGITKIGDIHRESSNGNSSSSEDIQIKKG